MEINQVIETSLDNAEINEITQNNTEGMTVLCSPCLGDTNNVAISNCKECDEYFCEPCDRTHSKLKATRYHTVIPVIPSLPDPINTESTIPDIPSLPDQINTESTIVLDPVLPAPSNIPVPIGKI